MDSLQRKKISLALKGRAPWNKGTHGLMPAQWNKGKSWSAEAKQKMSDSMKGRSPWNKGRHLSAIHRLRLSESIKTFRTRRAHVSQTK